MEQPASHEIRADTKSIRDLLRDQKYRLDYYQREYSWETKQVEELLADLEAKFVSAYESDDARTAVAGYPHYFLGSVIISRREGANHVIDGQQRLTTLTLLLIYLHRLQQGRETVVKVDDLIFSEAFGEISFNIDVEDRTRAMEALFQGVEIPTPTDNVSTANLIARYGDIEDRFPDQLGESGVLPYFIDWLIRNVDLVQIVAYNDDDAYTIFETMNDRGKPLSNTDMLKGYLLANVRDMDRQRTLDADWKRRIVELNSFRENEDADFFKSWLRSQYAARIRQRERNAQPEDFDKIGTAYHRFVRDERERIGLVRPADFDVFIERQMSRFADHYVDLRKAESEEVDGLRELFYNARNGFTMQPMLCLAPITIEDDRDIARTKMRLVGAYIDSMITRRVVNMRSLGYSTLVYAMFLLMRDIRGLSVADLARLLRDREAALEAETPWSAVRSFALHSRNRTSTRNLLARLISHLEEESGMNGPGFEGYTRRDIRDPYDIEHIWADQPGRHTDEFGSDHEFREYRNRLGGLLLVPASFNRSYGALPYNEKLPHYDSQNLLARSLHPHCYDRNPGFLRYVERSQQPFKPYPERLFLKAHLDERQALYESLLREIHSPSRFDFAVDQATFQADASA